MTTTMGTLESPLNDYPVSLDINRPETQSRLTNFPLGIGTMIRAILLIPHLIVLEFFGILAALVYLIASVAILFSGWYPLGLYNLVAGFTRWSANMNGYFSSLFDSYPPFSTDPQEGYPLTFAVTYPEQSSRLLNFPVLGLLIRYVLLVPHVIVVAFLGIAALILIFIAQFAILFTGSFPEGLHKFVTGYMRWSTRVNAYMFGLTDKYPPFSLS